MSLQRLLSGDPSRQSTVYLAIGGLSLAKAVAVRNDRDRFRQELADAALFIGVGLALRRYGKMRAQKREEVLESVPDWLADRVAGGTSESPVDRMFGGSEPASDPSVVERARRAVAR